MVAMGLTLAVVAMATSLGPALWQRLTLAEFETSEDRFVWKYAGKRWGKNRGQRHGLATQRTLGGELVGSMYYQHGRRRDGIWTTVPIAGSSSVNGSKPKKEKVQRFRQFRYKDGTLVEEREFPPWFTE